MPPCAQAQRKERTMKLILSRKGFDSASGGCPSPIFPDGTDKRKSMYSLPIPDCSWQDEVAYRDLVFDGVNNGVNVGSLVHGLTAGRIGAIHRAHLDPDINPAYRPNEQDWRGLFGQAGAAENHLCDQEVGEGDLFLFFGLYRRVEEAQGRWVFVKGAPSQHVLWGYLQVGEVIDEVNSFRSKLKEGQVEPHLRQVEGHPHLKYRDSPNTIYVSSPSLSVGRGKQAPGAGVFPRFDDRLLLTDPGQSASRWKLPYWFYPDGGKPALTYHDPKRTKSNRWTRRRGDGEHVYLHSVGRGQEFVLNLDEYPKDESREAVDWVRDLIRDLYIGAK